MKAQGGKRADKGLAIRGGPSRGLRREPPSYPTATAYTPDDEPRRVLTLPAADARVSRWWFVSGVFLLGIAALLAYNAMRDLDDDLPAPAAPPVILVGESTPAKGGAALAAEHRRAEEERAELAHEMRQLRERLKRVEEWQRRLARSLDVVD